MTNSVSSNEFARSFGIRKKQLAWLIGAGASAASNIATGWDMIVDFKAKLFCAAMSIPRSEIDPTDPLWQERIETYFDGAHGLPRTGSPDEYAAAFEAVYPGERDRRGYIDEAVQRGTPSFAHRVLASLITSADVQCLFTTNFDPLIERATVVTDELLPAEDRSHLTVGALDAVDRATRCLREQDWPLLVKLHGDYKSDRLKNTTSELQAQDEQLRALLVDSLTRFGLVVVGYSGRDDSIMDALADAISRDGSFPGGLWWVAKRGTTLLPRVRQVVEQAEAKGIDAHIVESENFDELAGDILDEVHIEPTLREHIDALRPRNLVEPVILSTETVSDFPVLRCSALELLGIPSEATEVAVSSPMNAVEARLLVKESKAWATVASRGSSVIAFGEDEQIERAFSSVGGRLQGKVDLHPSNSSTDLGLVYDALTRAICRRRPLQPMLRGRGHQVIIRPPDPDRTDEVAQRARQQLQEVQDAYGSPLIGRVPRINCDYAEGVRLRLENWDERWWCVYEPFTWVDLPRTPQSDTGQVPRATVPNGPNDPRAVSSDWRRERWAQRYNSNWNSIIAAWAKLIAPEATTTLTSHDLRSPGVDAVFTVSWTTAWSRPGRRLPVASP